ncbi:MAG: hypothetical protein FJ217_12885 [Ignavibacteria bacterium]|nr:hypothetical protein [Ignavibacteria bacterium]
MKNGRGIGYRLAIVAVSLLLALGFQELAQAQRMRLTPEDQAKRIKDSLTLSDEQTAKVKKIYEAQQAEMMEKMSGAMGDREAMRSAMQEVMAKYDKQIEALLTKEQLKKYEELKKQRQQMRGRMQQQRQQG